MDDTRISENIFLDTKETQVQPNTNASSTPMTISRSNFDWDASEIVNNNSRGSAVMQQATSQLRHQISIFTWSHQHIPPEKNINPEIDRVT